NILMFVPLGIFFLLTFGRNRWWVAILVGVATTAAIEFAQVFLPGRVSDVRDLIANSAGALLGVLIGLLLTASKARQLRARAATTG
ncbi:MAG: VanZ family protein, partial [Frankiales bacterium]|nr:VanZ family protein [Frankiales bacterium]